MSNTYIWAAPSMQPTEIIIKMYFEFGFAAAKNLV